MTFQHFLGIAVKMSKNIYVNHFAQIGLWIKRNRSKKFFRVHFLILNRIVKCTGTRISAFRVHQQTLHRVPGDRYLLFLRVTGRCPCQITRFIMSPVHRLPFFVYQKQKKADQVHFSILNLAGECTRTGKMQKWRSMTMLPTLRHCSVPCRGTFLYFFRLNWTVLEPSPVYGVLLTVFRRSVPWFSKIVELTKSKEEV